MSSDVVFWNTRKSMRITYSLASDRLPTYTPKMVLYLSCRPDDFLVFFPCEVQVFISLSMNFDNLGFSVIFTNDLLFYHMLLNNVCFCLRLFLHMI